MKNEGVQDGDGLFEMDERGNAPHQSTYAQVKPTLRHELHLIRAAHCLLTLPVVFTDVNGHNIIVSDAIFVCFCQ